MKQSTLQRPFAINLVAKATLFALTALCMLKPAMADESKQFDNFDSYAGTGYDQPYRPLFHFTSLRNWINDPNGLLYYDGEYHLFFQHNPLGQVWGNKIGRASCRERV